MQVAQRGEAPQSPFSNGSQLIVAQIAGKMRKIQKKINNIQQKFESGAVNKGGGVETERQPIRGRYSIQDSFDCQFIIGRCHHEMAPSHMTNGAIYKLPTLTVTFHNNCSVAFTVNYVCMSLIKST